MTVPVPSVRKAGFRRASDSGVEPSRMHSSRTRSTPGYATTSSPYCPAAQAAAALRWLSRAKRSWASRVMPCFSAMSSAPSPSEPVHSAGMRGLVIRQPRVVDHICWWPAGKGRSGFCTTQGARLIDSTPPAMATEASPSAMARAAWMTASRPEPQSLLTVTPGTDTGSPASRTAIRATSRLSSPAPLASPKTTSSMRAGSRSGVRSTSARTTCAARSSGRTPA